MSKLLKRTLALTLIFCLILSVIPAVSAEGESTSVFYDYDLTNISGKTKAAYEAGTYNHYYIGSSTTSTNGSSAVWLDQAYQDAAWIAYTIEVKETADFEMIIKHYGGSRRGVGRFRFYNWTEEFETQAATKPSFSWNLDVVKSGTKVLEVSADSSVAYNNIQTGASYVGKVQLTAGKYILVISNKDLGVGSYQNPSHVSCTAPTASSKRYSFSPVALTLVKGTATDAIQDAMNDISVSAKSTSTTYTVHLEADATVGNLQIPTNVWFDLNGKTLTADVLAVTNGDRPGQLADLKGEGKLVIGTAPVVTSENGYWRYESGGTLYCRGQMVMYDAVNAAYKLVTPKVNVKPGAEAAKTNPYEVEEGTMRFGFDVALPEAAYAYVKDENAPMKLWFTVKVGDDKAKTYEFDEIDQDWIDSKSEGKAFYVDIKGIDQLDPETTVVLTPYIQVKNVSISCGAITYTTPAA